MKRAVTRMRSWFEDGQFRRLFRNAGILLGGNLSTSALDLVSLALTARALGAELFGILVLIHTYITVVDSLVNFQSWQALIKYGADALVQNRREPFKRLIKFGTYLDLSTAVLATFLAIGGIYWFGPWWGLSPETVQMATLYSFVIVFHLASTPTAILRLFDRFHWMAAQRAGTAAVKVICVGIAYLAGAGLWVFLLIWIFTAIAGYLLLLGLGWYELRQKGYERIMSVKLRDVSQESPGLWKFVGTTNLSSSIRLGAEQVDILIVGAVLGTSAAGIFKVVKKFGDIPGQLGQPIQQTAYPEMAKLWAQGAVEKFQSHILRIGILSGMGGLAIWLCFLVAGEWILGFVLGAEYGSAYALLLVYMLGNVIYMFGVAFRPAVLSMLHPERILYIYLWGHVVFFGVLFVLLDRIGVMGAAIAQVTFHVCWFVGMAFSIVGFLRQGARAPLSQPAT